MILKKEKKVRICFLLASFLLNDSYLKKWRKEVPISHFFLQGTTEIPFFMKEGKNFFSQFQFDWDSISENSIIFLTEKSMSRYRGPRLRLVRRLGELPGLTSKIPKKQTSPGQHGQSQLGRRRKLSQYSVRLREKQRLRFHYGVTESQLLNYVRQARKIKGPTGELVLQLLEMRLDSVLFRLGMAPTIAAARQLISHGHIVLNGQKLTIPSYQCDTNDIISVSSKKHSRELVQTYLENSRPVPSHLTLQKDNFLGKISKITDRESIGLKVNELLIVEFYSRKI